jgi:hypothetical protein
VPPAVDGGGESHEGLVDLVADFPADAQPSEPVQQVIAGSIIHQLIQLPDGFTEHDPSRELDPLLGRLLAGGGRSAVVPDGGSLDARFPGSAVTSSTRITGDTDWTVYVVTTIREALAAALGLLRPGTKRC